MRIKEILKTLFEYKIAFISICVFIAILPVICSKKFYRKIYIDSELIQNVELKPINTRIISEKEDYEIYSILVKELYLKDERIKVAIVSGKTYKDKRHQPEEIQKFLTKEMPTLEKETLNSFNILDHEAYTLKNKFSTKVTTLLSNSKEFKELPKNYFTFGGYDVTNSASIKSTGVIAFSRIGFNKAHTQCLVNVGHFCTNSCSSSQIILLDKVDGNWIISGKSLMWIS